MTEGSFPNLEALPRGPLTMALMVQLEPPPLRRLLKKGLRRGLSTAELRQCLDADWGLALESESASSLLKALQDRRWFISSADADVWKTHLGS
ncbi:hypothetical protein [Synechococcus sp. CS-197]|jgi:hypothetical protein|uniref:hypothetical protein n=1 Tax=Synechococcus sp. CS-197 TaxID=2847985 RepID=UPI000152539A|nr:hypothetical protein [Synechococcus sp. CS-197]MCT0250155.1 hypothetical protein [Synechococcus sp. CS-197]PTT95552.1 hypothetical protein DBR45_48540 [Pseudomonas sp. HMWF031]CAK24692.1 Hypothetical protein SynWH7803_2266 [Synechococcus sp. WH 7803]